jgi:hypothetical protein
MSEKPRLQVFINLGKPGITHAHSNYIELDVGDVYGSEISAKEFTEIVYKKTQEQQNVSSYTCYLAIPGRRGKIADDTKILLTPAGIKPYWVYFENHSTIQLLGGKKTPRSKTPRSKSKRPRSKSKSKRPRSRKPQGRK